MMINNDDGVISLYPRSERKREREGKKGNAPEKYCLSHEDFFFLFLWRFLHIYTLRLQ